MTRDELTESQAAAYAAISDFFWKRYGLRGIDSPGYVSQLLLQQLEGSGLEITTKGEPMDKITLIERSIREDIAGRIEDLCICTTFSGVGCDHMRAALIARGVKENAGGTIE